jgi:hypothetical protein
LCTTHTHMPPYYMFTGLQSLHEHRFMVVQVKACRILVQQCTARADSNERVDERIRYGVRKLLQQIAPGYEALDRRVKRDFEMYLDQEAQQRTARIAKGKENREERERLQVQSVLQANAESQVALEQWGLCLLPMMHPRQFLEHECTAGDVVCRGGMHTGMCTVHGYTMKDFTLVALLCIVCAHSTVLCRRYM